MLAESLAAQGGALKVNTASEIQEAIIGLLRDELCAKDCQTMRGVWLDIHRGATARGAHLIAHLGNDNRT